MNEGNRIELTEENIEVLRIIKGRRRKMPITTAEVKKQLGQPASGYIRTMSKKGCVEKVVQDGVKGFMITPKGAKTILAWNLLMQD